MMQYFSQFLFFLVWVAVPVGAQDTGLSAHDAQTINVQQIDDAFAQGRYAQAIRGYHQLLDGGTASDDDLVDVRIKLAQSYYLSQQISEAKQQLLLLNDSVDARVALLAADIAIAEQRWAEAKTLLEPLVLSRRGSPSSTEYESAQMRLIQVYRHFGQTEAAEKLSTILWKPYDIGIKP